MGGENYSVPPHQDAPSLLGLQARTPGEKRVCSTPCLSQTAPLGSCCDNQSPKMAERDHTSQYPLPQCPLPLFFFFFFFLVFLSFLGPHPWHMEVPRLGSNRSCSRRPMPGPQQRGIRAEPATYTTAHRNTGSLTH